MLALACPAPVESEPIDGRIDSAAPSADPADPADTDPADSGPPDTQPPEDTAAEPVTAPDYSQPGAWSAAHLAAETVNGGGDALYLQVWYPTEAEGPARIYGWEGYQFTGDAVADAAPACATPRPVMVHSHGNASISWEMFWWQELAATHGWITVAPDHPGNTFYDSTQDFATLLVQRPADLVSTFDWLVEQSASGDSPLAGCVDPEAGYVVTGWSFGGYTAYVTGGALANGSGGEATADRSDERVTAVVTYAPWDGAENLTTGTSAIDVPVLSVGAARDATVGQQYLDLYEPVTSLPRGLAAFANAGHLSFTPIYCTLPGDGCGDAFVDTERFKTAVGLATLAFLGHVRGEQGAVEQLPAEDEELSWDLTLE